MTDPIVDAVRLGAVLRYERQQEAQSRIIFRPSALGSCQRQLYLRSHQAPEERISAKSALTLEHGTLRGRELVDGLFMAIHQGLALTDWQPVAKELRVNVPVPRPEPVEGPEDPCLWPADLALAIAARTGLTTVASDEHYMVMLSGSADVVLRDPEGRLVVGDFKTAHPFSYKSKKNSAPDASYMAQIGAYCYGVQLLASTGAIPSDGMLNPWLLYESKDDHSMFRQEIDLGAALEATGEALVRTGRTLIDVVRGNAPEPDYGPNEKGQLPWQCRYCPVYRSCWAERITNIEGDPSLPKSITID